MLSRMNENNICHEVVISRGREGASREEILATSRQLQQWAEQQPGFLRRTLLEAEQGVWIDHVEWSSESAAKEAAAKFNESGCAEALERLLDFTSMQLYHARAV